MKNIGLIVIIFEDRHIAAVQLVRSHTAEKFIATCRLITYRYANPRILIIVRIEMQEHHIHFGQSIVDNFGPFNNFACMKLMLWVILYSREYQPFVLPIIQTVG